MRILGVTPTRLAVLEWLLQNPEGGRLADVCKGVGLETSPVLFQLKQLVKVGVVNPHAKEGRRNRYTVNRRVFLDAMTEFGRRNGIGVVSLDANEPEARLARLEEAADELNLLLRRARRELAKRSPA